LVHWNVKQEADFNSLIGLCGSCTWAFVHDVGMVNFVLGSCVFTLDVAEILVNVLASQNVSKILFWLKANLSLNFA
jgi:hypothetical protein